ncbi:MAG TPA: MerC domain-containing protein, partial [Puia sp.]|nr:MerC domain-containing protein [Puia sp.]
MFRKINLDALGVTTSILCAIHCAILPLVMASLPILGINILHNSFFEYGMIALAFAIGTVALWHGFS